MHNILYRKTVSFQCFCRACKAEAVHMYCFSVLSLAMAAAAKTFVEFLRLCHFLKNYKG